MLRDECLSARSLVVVVVGGVRAEPVSQQILLCGAMRPRAPEPRGDGRVDESITHAQYCRLSGRMLSSHLFQNWCPVENLNLWHLSSFLG